jgi:hypothetical protein
MTTKRNPLFEAHQRRMRAKPRFQGGAPKTAGANIIATKVVDGREYQLHATKGWRSRRA